MATESIGNVQKARRGIAEVWKGFGAAIIGKVFPQFEVLNLAFGTSHGLLLTSDHKVYSFTCGINGHGGNNGVDISEPSLVSALSNVVAQEIVCGPLTSAVICEDGSLYMWGNNSAGQCGVSWELSLINLPTLVALKDCIHTCPVKKAVAWQRVKVTQVSCGETHTLALTNTGEIWAWGTGIAVGLDSSDRCVKPSKLTSLCGKYATWVTCGAQHSLVIISTCNSCRPSPSVPPASCGCDTCDSILQHGNGSYIEFDPSVCPLGLSTQSLNDAVDFKDEMKSPKDKLTKELENAAARPLEQGSRNGACSVVDEHTAEGEEVVLRRKSVEQTQCQEENIDSIIEDCNSLTRISQAECETEEICDTEGGKTRIMKQRTLVNSLTCNSEVSYANCSPSTSNSSECSTTDSPSRSYLSVHSVRNFLTRQLSITSSKNVAASLRGSVANASNVSQDFSQEEFNFVSKSGGCEEYAIQSESMQELELMSYDSSDSDLHDMSSSSDYTLHRTRRPVGRQQSKVSSYERVNIIQDPLSGVLAHFSGSLATPSDADYANCGETEVWSWGKGNLGQLGHGDALDRSQPTRVTMLSNIGIMKVVAGYAHNLALTSSGQVYIWGSNSHCQLAVPDNNGCIFSPRLLVGSEKSFVWDIAAGHKISLLLMNHQGEQEIYFCGKQEGPLEKSTSVKTPSLLLHQLTEMKRDLDSRIRRIAAGGCYAACLLDETSGDHLSILYELMITELQFFGFLETLANVTLMPILSNGDMINNCGQTIKLLFESYIDISRNTSRNGHQLRHLIQNPNDKATLPIFCDIDRQLSLYENYCLKFCDALANNGFETCLRVAHSVFKSSSKTLWDLSTEDPVKGDISPEAFQHLMEEPIRRMTQYKKLFSNLSQKHKQRDIPRHWELSVAERWSCLITKVSIQKQDSEKTRAFWDICPSKMADALKKPSRRFIRDSKTNPVHLLNAGRFQSHWFILFNDAFVHHQYSGWTVYDLSLVWVDPAPDLNKNGSVFSISVPEETLNLSCEPSHAKTEWVCAINDAINRKLKLNRNKPTFKKVVRTRGTSVRRMPPLNRHAIFTFSKSSTYKDATYNGMWFCGQMQGQGEIVWPDGRKYIGSFKQNKYDGYGTYYLPSCKETVYKGIWKNGKLNGFGSIRYSSGDYYEGYLKDSFRDGHGLLKCGRFLQSAASIYVGEWVNDKKHGYGVMDDIEQGKKYMGMWQEDYCHGKGMLVSLDGAYFEGNFSKGHIGGHGLTFDNSCWYEGEVGPDGVFNGKGCLTLACGGVIEGQFSGSWNEGIRINGIFTKSSSADHRQIQLDAYPRMYGTLCVQAHEKWTGIFRQFYDLLGITKFTDTEKAWEAVAVVVTTWKKHEKVQKGRYLHLSSSSLSALERIPRQNGGRLTAENYAEYKSYLQMAFETPYHPLGKLMDGLVDVYRATYVGIGAHPCLLHHAIEEIKSLTNRMNDVIRILFPSLPANGAEVILDTDVSGDDRLAQGTRSGDGVVTTEGLLLPIFLPKLYPPLFTLYALRYEKDDNLYWETLLKWNKQPDLALMTFLEVDEKFWFLTEDSGSILSKRASMSSIRNCHYLKAIDTLQQLSTTFSPLEKLLIVQKVFEEINKEVANVVSSNYLWTMDDLFPVFQYVVVRACIKHLGSEIHMIDDLMEKRLQNGELGLMFTMLKACYFQVTNERSL